MQDAMIYLWQASLFLGQLRLVPKIGQRSQLMFKGVGLQNDYKGLQKYNYSTTTLDTNTYN